MGVKLGKGWNGTCINCPKCGEYIWLKIENEKVKAKKRAEAKK
jgi:phage terminase large subunit GpA-like protein